MKTQGIIILVLIGATYLAWVVNLTRQGKLHVSYAVVWVVLILLGVLIVIVPPLLYLMSRVVGTVFPTSTLSVLAFGVLFAMQIYLLSQLSILSQRVSRIAQQIAIDKADTATYHE
ncbi:MAG: DUF2304 domain-containing protein [Anaerolineae bacterium]|nr:DUF2304 domain-containing protein [Anaerolineae bacterium]